jgi:glycosyltransferase involved in cell wall biosynthesis
MTLDVVVPTYNRSQLLRRTISSLLTAPIPDGLKVTIIVVDNNSKDDTRQAVEEFGMKPDCCLRYIHESKQGLSHSRNGGIAAGTGELIGFIDDDEEIEENWYRVVAREFEDPEIQFIGGCCLGNWSAPAPDWLPEEYNAAIGVVPPKQRARYDPAFKGSLTGGNAVVRRSVFEQIGNYSIRLGRSGKGLLSEEDADFLRRLRENSVVGMHVPELVIYHYIPKDRLTRQYHRRWVFWRAVSQGVLDRDLRGNTRYFLGVPRYKLGSALRGLYRLLRYCSSNKTRGKAFAGELASWELAGFLYGKYFVQIDKLYRAST